MRLLPSLAATADTIGLAGALLGLLATPVADGTPPAPARVVQDAPTGVSSHRASPRPLRPCRSPRPASEFVQAAVEVLTVDDTGRGWPAARWAQARVEVAVRGPAATPEVLADIGQVLGWMTQVTGTRFVRTDAPRAPFQVVLAAGRAPAGTIRQTGHRIVTASVGWDPTHPHADRWTWEELLQMAGPAGDHGPAGTLLSTDQTARAPTAFDRWVLHTLYQVPDHQLGADALREALAASLADHVGPGADGPML